MCQRTIFSRSFFRIAEEVQLQAEEEWIIEALRKIKQERNCLQIERLHLESLKAKLKEPIKNKTQKEVKGYNPHVSAVDMMNPTLGNMRHGKEFEGMDDDALCNEQELNLMVAKPGYNASQKDNNPYDFNADEESEDEDGDNVMIDINMLMNGNIEKDI